MTESFLHFIWQFQYFQKGDLLTAEGEPIQVFHPGNHNSHAGPDFSEARIKIGSLEWRGSVEIHIHASGWNDHHHGSDQAYEKVILHVVWENDKPVQRTDGTVMPTLMLKNRVDLSMWNRYKKLYTSAEAIPCSNSWSKIADITKLSMLEKTVVQRLEMKAALVKDLLVRNNHNWEETCLQLLAKNFGFKVNTEPMLQLAQGLPYKILLKHPEQIQALLFGQAGFLEKIKEDEYSAILKREYALLSKKYDLGAKQLNQVQWRFLRLRPSNFPTIRIGQFAALLRKHQNLFSKIVESATAKDCIQLFDVDQPEYWKHHYQFGKKSKNEIPSLGKSSIENILINSVAPLLVAYGRYSDDQTFVDRAVEILQSLAAENNKITRLWSDMGHTVNSAFDSQGLIELYNNFCMKRRCLECVIGSQIIKS